MKKWTTVDSATTADGKSITLEEHDGSFTIRVDRVPLMSTRQHGSEEKMAELACAELQGTPGARVLIGGLGFGYTLRSALAALPPDASVVVAEILEAVIRWNRDPALRVAGDALADPRVRVVVRDVFEVIRAERGGFDGIILDVDNGPGALSTEGNERLYGPAGLKLIRAALRPEGTVAFWSAAPDKAFEDLMVRAGFDVEVRNCRAHGTSGRRQLVFLGRVK